MVRSATQSLHVSWIWSSARDWSVRKRAAALRSVRALAREVGRSWPRVWEKKGALATGVRERDEARRKVCGRASEVRSWISRSGSGLGERRDKTHLALDVDDELDDLLVDGRLLGLDVAQERVAGRLEFGDGGAVGDARLVGSRREDEVEKGRQVREADERVGRRIGVDDLVRDDVLERQGVEELLRRQVGGLEGCDADEVVSARSCASCARLGRTLEGLHSVARVVVDRPLAVVLAALVPPDHEELLERRVDRSAHELSPLCKLVRRVRVAADEARPPGGVARVALLGAEVARRADELRGRRRACAWSRGGGGGARARGRGGGG